MLDPISNKALRQAVRDAFHRAFADWSRMAPEEWCEEVFRLKGGGRFRWSYAPYAKEMFLSLFDNKNIETVLQLYSRGLKSTVVLMAIGYVIDQLPQNILAMWPTNSQAEKWAKDILVGELFDCVERLRFLGSAGKKRTGYLTILHKVFPGGLIDAFGANAPGDLRRAKGSFIYADEIDAMENTEADEGDILAILNKRADEYEKSIRVFASYPSIKGLSRINARLLESDYNQWRVTCVKCGGEPYTMLRSMLRYDDGKPETAVLECPKCKASLTDTNRYEMAQNGLWHPLNPFRGRKGFQANSLLWPHPVDKLKYPGGYLQMLAQKEIDVKKAENPKRAERVLVNTDDAEPFDPSEETEKPPEWQTLFARRENYTKAPLEARVAIAMVDMQNNRLEVEWKAFAPNEESWGIRHVVIDGNTKDPLIWEKNLVRELERGVEREDGAHMPLSRAFIDAGWAGDMVLHFLRYIQKEQRPIYGKVKASKGMDRGPIVANDGYKAVTKNLKGHHIGTWTAKDVINNRLRMPSPVGEDGKRLTGYMHYNQSYDEQFFQQLCTGIPTVEWFHAEEERRYLNKDKLKDEALDLAVGTLAAFRSRRWQFETIEAELLATIPERKAVQPVEEKKEKKRLRCGVTW